MLPEIVNEVSLKRIFFHIYVSKCKCFKQCGTTRIDVFLLHLQNEGDGLYTGDGSVDIKGNRVLKQNTGNWRACPFILGDALFFAINCSCASM